MNEADTCRKYVVPKLLDAGWDTDPHSIAEQRAFTDGRIVVQGSGARRLPQKRADYLLRHARDLPMAVVEAKADYKLPGDGLQQAKEYAQILDLKFAYSTNGQGIIEFDYTTGKESEIDTFPTPDELWSRFQGAKKLTPDSATRLLAPANLTKEPRYYQYVAIQRTIEAILQRRLSNEGKG
jgi:type I restriction enzyme, R subunit